MASMPVMPLLQSSIYTPLKDILEEEGPPVGEGSYISGETPQAAEQPEFQLLLSEVERLAASNTATKSALDELQGPLAQLQEALTSIHNVGDIVATTLCMLFKASCICASGA